MKNYCTYWVKNRIGALEYIGRSYIEKVNNGYPNNKVSHFYRKHLKPWLDERGLEYNKDDYWVEIQQVFGPNKDAVKWHEENLCRLHDVVDSDNFFNENYGAVPGPKIKAKLSAIKKGKNYGRTGENHPRYGKKHSDEAIEKMRTAKIGYNPHANKSDEEMEEFKATMRVVNKGRNKGKKYFYNPTTNHCVRIYPPQIDEYIKNGYKPGIRPRKAR